METTTSYRDYFGVMKGLYWDSGKENGNYHIVKGLYRGYKGVLNGLYRGYTEVIWDSCLTSAHLLIVYTY